MSHTYFIGAKIEGDYDCLNSSSLISECFNSRGFHRANHATDILNSHVTSIVRKATFQ